MSPTSLHALLLLSDSALPLGSFAFSSGLESFLAHRKASQTCSASKLQDLDGFLTESLHNVSSSSLPYLISAFRRPQTLPSLDNDFDASMPCTVARRASVTQGRALLTIWERALATSAPDGPARSAVSAFASALRPGRNDSFGMKLEAHFPPLFGAVCQALELPEHEASYLFLLNHAKAVLSAAVRAGMMGPYQSHAILASAALQATISRCITNDKERLTNDAYVSVPTLDIWMGRHELLYSRIFNS